MYQQKYIYIVEVNNKMKRKWDVSSQVELKARHMFKTYRNFSNGKSVVLNHNHA